MDRPFLKLVSYFILLINSFNNFASCEVDIPTYYNHNCTINNNFTTNSPYQFNLNNLLVSLYTKATVTDNTSPELPYNATISTASTDNPDTVYGGYVCRGDVPIQVCQNCVLDAINRLTSECPNNKEAIIWYDECFLRYSDRCFFSSLNQLPTVSSQLAVLVGPITRCTWNKSTPCGIPSYLGNTNQTDMGYTRINRSEPDANAYGVLNRTLNDAAIEAAASGKKFETKEGKLNGSWESVYTLVQCKPDLSPQLCRECLNGMVERIPRKYIALTGRILNPSCNLRFGVDRFYYQGSQPPSNAQELGRPSLADYNCSSTEANDAYLKNLKNVFDYLSSSSNITQNKGFNTTNVGNKPDDTVYGLFMCRGDVPLDLCYECVNEGIQKLNSSCSSSKEAIIWYDMCMLRYSNHSFFSTLETQPSYTKPGADMLQSQVQGFYRLLVNTLDNLVAATPKSLGVKNFATKTEPMISELKTLYSLAQCTPNLSSQDCQKCLQGGRDQIDLCCRGKAGGQVMNPSCNLRFESYVFYISNNNSAVSQPPVYPPNSNNSVVEPPASTQNTGTDQGHSLTIVIAVSITTTVVSIMLFCFDFYYCQRKKSTSYKEILEKNFGIEGATLESLQFNLPTIEAATNKFSFENRVGKGGFGEVYVGILPDGSKIAVKRLSENSSQGLLEFKNEVLLIAKLQHRNLVTLLGFCLKDEEKILVYEYVPNKSLDYFLFGSQKPRVLNWQERYKIIEGIARGIIYLHEHSRLKVIHRDLKPSNILLDDEMNPKISDFGMARMVGISETRGSTNRIVGTLGYMAPEYMKFGLFSDKSDVFSFGVIVLEIISGKNINSQCESQESQYAGGLLSDAWKHWRDEELIAILDSNLIEAGSHSEIIKCLHIGLLCVQGNPQVRPSMNQVVQYLSNDSMKLPVPQEPAFFFHSQMEAAETNSRAVEAQLIPNQNQYSINEMSENTILSPR